MGALGEDESEDEEEGDEFQDEDPLNLKVPTAEDHPRFTKCVCTHRRHLHSHNYPHHVQGLKPDPSLSGGSADS